MDVKIRWNKENAERITGHVTKMRRSNLPIITLGAATNGLLNKHVRVLTNKNQWGYIDFYRDAKGTPYVMFSKEKVSGSSKLIYTSNNGVTRQITFCCTNIKRFVFDKVSKQIAYHLALIPTSEPNIFALRNIVSDYE